jgi:hypothetical protein
MTGDLGLMGLPMFSKAGKFLNENYSVFRKKHEILLDKPKYQHVSYCPKFKMQMQDEPSDNRDEIFKKKLTSSKQGDTSGGNPDTREWAKATGRYNHWKHKQTEKEKTMAPDSGVYHPKHVEKKTKILPEYSKEVKTNLEPDRFYDPTALDLEKSFTADVDIQLSGIGKLKKKLQGYVKFASQTARHDLRDTNGSRFDNR